MDLEQNNSEPQVKNPIGDVIPVEGPPMVPVEPEAEKPAQDEPEAPKPDTSVRSAVEAAFKAAKEQEATAARLRDEKGRFAKKEGDAPTPQVSGESPIQEEKAPSAPEVIQAPNSWAKEDRELFKSLPAEIQKRISIRESERDRATQTALQRAARLEQVEQTISQNADILNVQGVPPVDAVRNLFNAQRKLDADPVGSVLQIMQGYNLSIEDLAGYAQGAHEATTNPAYAQLQQQLRSVTAYIQNLERSKEESVQAERLNAVSAFAKESDASGQPLRPHMEKVSHLMAPIIAQLRVQQPSAANQAILQQAYESACWAEPSVRQTLIATHAAEEAKKRDQERQARVTKAKEASVSLNGAPGGVSSTQPRTWEEAVRQAIEQHRYS